MTIEMKLTTFVIHKHDRLGAVVGEKIFDLNAAYSAYLESEGVSGAQATANAHLPERMRAFIELGDIALEAAGKALDFLRKENYGVEGAVFKLDEVKLRAPIPDPPKIVCTGLNYEDYRAILGLEYLPVPQIFLKAPSSVIGHLEPIVIPEGYGSVFHEYEFSCVIGKRCKDVPKEEVHDFIFGYTILNDITAHDIELITREYQQWAKSFDTFAPMGPWIVTPEEMPKNLYNLKILRRRNRKVEFESNTKNMRFHFDDIISFASTFWTLEPGTIVTTASPPAGPIEPEDVIEAEVEGVGVLRNPVTSRRIPKEYAKRLGLI
jgi:acylpyruvate hydrolase